MREIRLADEKCNDALKARLIIPIKATNTGTIKIEHPMHNAAFNQRHHKL